MTRQETLDFAMEQGLMVQALLEHCHNTKRQETRLRLATAFLIAAFLATLVWVQFHQLKTDAFSGARVEALTTDEGSHRRCSAYLKTDPNKNACSQQQTKEQLIHWSQMSYGLDHQRFNLTDSSVLHVFTKGFYLINLRISYRIARHTCQHTHRPILEVKVTQQHSNYKEERDVITAVESMPCILYWQQSVTLNRVVMLEDDTDLRVKINSNTCKYVNWYANGDLEVTYF
ncbi:uncharacterized protein LOC130570040 [Triplophysa rosa]|uniref:THD domain-containing protein n=1 Tax=Triplophysa rosa TaxID=992332 RepID=A0A9W8CAC1_TRIRA|nr:uncharacterized protein LOC130570040 [Triplophysa rosa]KAI7813371.1 hypothetical protein IRJ41_016700 [Triplophysa rosa]